MIHRIYSNKKSFKSVEFNRGLNLIIAEKTSESGKKDTRNGSGKTTLINIISFCLGGDLKVDVFPTQDIIDWKFSIEIDLFSCLIKGTRSIQNPNIIVVEGEFGQFPILPEEDKDDSFYFYKKEAWKNLLGICLFDIENNSEKYRPTFRSLISYFIRSTSGAYIEPFSYFKSQSSWSKQVNNAFLLGLNWSLASAGQEIEDKRKTILALDSSIKCGINPNKGELEVKRIQLITEIDKESKTLNEFKVLPQYKDLQEQANCLTRYLHDSMNRLLLLKQKLSQYKKTIHAETNTDKQSVETLYAEAGLIFPDMLKKSLDEVQLFHKAIVHNRKEFLRDEINQISIQIEEEEESIQNNSEKRATLMQLLEVHGALEEFTQLQNFLLSKKRKLDNIKEAINDINKISENKKKIKTEKIELESKLQRDYEFTRSKWEKAIVIFNENSKALYDSPGDLIINTTERGYEFDVDIKKGNSEGISKMKIFCYDLMLLELFSLKRNIDFLIHDSTLYDSVDSRQRALALVLVKEKSEKYNMQYICALNSDMIPYDDLPDRLDINEHICLRIKDKLPSDSILGFQFEIPKARHNEFEE